MFRNVVIINFPQHSIAKITIISTQSLITSRVERNLFIHSDILSYRITRGVTHFIVTF